MLRIGDLRLGGDIVLGPMAGYTSEAYREFMGPFGAAAAVSEMVSDQGVVHGSPKSMAFCRFERSYPTGLQLFGHDPDVLARASSAALGFNPDIDFFDVNMGCPIPKVLRSGSGSALMSDPHLCGAIVRRMKREVDVPVTAKIRLGRDYGSMNFRTVIDELQSADVDAISLHVRTAEERYLGKPHYDLVEGLRGEMSVPLVISGNVFSLEEALHALRTTGADGVMVARGGVGNPNLLTRIDTYLRTGRTVGDPTVSRQIDWCLDLACRMVEEKGEELGIRKMRCLAPRFIIGCRDCRMYRHRLATEPTDMGSLERILEEIRDRKGDQRILSNGFRGETDQGF